MPPSFVIFRAFVCWLDQRNRGTHRTHGTPGQRRTIRVICCHARTTNLGSSPFHLRSQLLYCFSDRLPSLYPPYRTLSFCRSAFRTAAISRYPRRPGPTIRPSQHRAQNRRPVDLSFTRPDPVLREVSGPASLLTCVRCRKTSSVLKEKNYRYEEVPKKSK